MLITAIGKTNKTQNSKRTRKQAAGGHNTRVGRLEYAQNYSVPMFSSNYYPLPVSKLSCCRRLHTPARAYRMSSSFFFSTNKLPLAMFLLFFAFYFISQYAITGYHNLNYPVRRYNRGNADWHQRPKKHILSVFELITFSKNLMFIMFPDIITQI